MENCAILHIFVLNSISLGEIYIKDIYGLREEAMLPGIFVDCECLDYGYQSFLFGEHDQKSYIEFRGEKYKTREELDRLKFLLNQNKIKTLLESV